MELLGVTTLVLVVSVICLSFLSVWTKTRPGGRLPPGPTPLPVIGNILQLNFKDVPASLSKLAKDYGPIYTLYFGSWPTVVLHGYDVVKEALLNQGDEFLGRGPFPIIEDSLKGSGLVFTNGETWKVLRRFSLMTLKNFGMGKRSLEERVQEEAQCLVEELQKMEAGPFDPTFILACAPCNVICSILFNERFPYRSKTILNLMDLLNKNFHQVNSVWCQMYNLWPTFMKYVPGKHKEVPQRINDINNFILEKIKEHQESLDPANPRDYIDCFLSKIEEEKHNPKSEFDLKNLIASGASLFTAGTETTSITLRFGILLLLKYPEVQAKIHEEIDHVIGRHQPPSMKDKMKLPYTNAVLHEIQRYTTLLPSSLPHAVVKDTKFRDYIIPKGTVVLPLLSSILLDHKEFPNPETFDPGHFLDKNGCFKKTDYFVPFSLGKRSCMGESLAIMELFLFLTTILQKFSLKSPVEPRDLDIKPAATGLINIPPPYKLCLIPR
ncbi:cytochrome P450 2C23 [Cricetulus griseus]|uniref:Cytochrome P450 2C23 n=1 Tax=Cricetulus griseus TaxID=10029 RepID=A0A8C2MKD1_CRIGR|nr:cytochrome P450 2C23 [Cricetulus griseus]XP_027263050.1 cytochrome P450 2C23 [Cricetulus griseus]